MFAIEEYRTYESSGDKSVLNSVVTLDNSENSHQEYFKRLLLRRLYLFDDITERQAEIMLRRWGFQTAPQSLEEIGREFGVTRERIRQIEAKGIHKMKYPDKHSCNFLQVYTTCEEFAKALELLCAEDAVLVAMIEEFAHLPTTGQ